MGDIQQGSDNTNAGNGSANQPGEAFRQDYLSELAGPPSSGGKVPERPENPQGEPAQPTGSGGDADPPRRGDADPPTRGDADPPRQGGNKAADPERPSEPPPAGGADANQDSSSDSGSEGTKSAGSNAGEGTFPSVHDHGNEMPPKKGGADPGVHDGSEPGPKPSGSDSEQPSSTGSGGDLIIPPLDYGSGAGSGPK